MSISHEDYLDIKREMGAKSAKEAVKASYDHIHPNFRKGRENMDKIASTKHGKKVYGDAVGKAKSKALAKKSGLEHDSKKHGKRMEVEMQKGGSGTYSNIYPYKKLS